jgi:hypothetical protein
VDLAETHPFEVFARAVRHWERLADADGTHRAYEAAHAGRTARMALVGETGSLDARVGAAQFAAMSEVFDRFAQAEFEAEWDELRAAHGDAACPGMLARTEAQRRADALAAIFDRAASVDPAAKSPEPVVNIVVDQAVYEAQLSAMVGERCAVFDASDLAHQRCLTTGGVPVDPADAVVASIIGQVRRVLIDRRGDHRPRTPIPGVCRLRQGRRPVARGFRRRRAMSVAGLRATTMPGRPHPRVAPRWGHRAAQRGPLCARHNRFKSRGYRCWRDPTGAWHTYRADGTEIQAA